MAVKHDRKQAKAKMLETLLIRARTVIIVMQSLVKTIVILIIITIIIII